MTSGDSFGALFKLARERRHKTQQDAADELGVDRKTIDNWEHDRTYPRNRMGAIYAWAPELGEDADPDEAELRTTLERLRDRENPLIDDSGIDRLVREYRERKRRGNSVAERAG